LRGSLPAVVAPNGQVLFFNVRASFTAVATPFSLATVDASTAAVTWTTKFWRIAMMSGLEPGMRPVYCGATRMSGCSSSFHARHHHVHERNRRHADQVAGHVVPRRRDGEAASGSIRGWADS
jgi:hypothetical protein